MTVEAATVDDVLAGRARYSIAHSRCEAFARGIPDGSVNLLWLDPPFFRVVDEEWDRAWPTEAAYLKWLRVVIGDAARVLAPNGSLYVFASPQMGGRVETATREVLDVLNHIVWVKRQGWHAKAEEEAQRLYFPQTERVIFAEPRGADSVAFVFEPLRSYLASEVSRAGWNERRLCDAMGFAKGSGMLSHYFGRSQWQLPTASHYVTMRRLLGAEYLRREYEDLRRPFAADAVAFNTDVWEYDTVAPSATKHPCEKPAAMLRDVVRCSSRPGDVVGEWFGGSFRMVEVALAEGRRYIGCDADAHWYGVGAERARAAVTGTVAAVAARKSRARADDRQGELFGGVK